MWDQSAFGYWQKARIYLLFQNEHLRTHNVKIVHLALIKVKSEYKRLYRYLKNQKRSNDDSQSKLI